MKSYRFAILWLISFLLAPPTLAQTSADEDVLILDRDMRKLYHGALTNAQSKLLDNHPVILALFTEDGGQFTLYRPGQPPLQAPRVPLRYELVKSISHSCLATFAHVYSNTGRPLDSWRQPLEEYLATSKTALKSVEGADLPQDWKQNQREILGLNISLMEKVLREGSVSEEYLAEYAKELRAYLKINIAWAAETQVGHWMDVMAEWKELIGPEWDKTMGATNTIYVTRQNNILYFIMAQYFGKEALNSRLLLFESSGFTTDPQQMLSMLARVVADREVGNAFFGDYYLMDYELMGSDARKAIEKEVSSRGLQLALPALVPFHSSEWPMRHDPSQGKGPAQLDDLEGNSAEPTGTEEKQQFVYLLRLKPEYLDAEKWTDRERELVAAHFEFLRKLQTTNELVTAGRTYPVDPNGFGIVVLEVPTIERAREIMEMDDPVKAGMMTTTLLPYKTVLERE